MMPAKKNLFFVLTLFSVIVLCSNCTNDKRELSDLDIMCDTISVTYDAVIKPIVLSNCARSGCHDGMAQVDFSSYSDMSPYLLDGSIKLRINLPQNDGAFMPDDAPLDHCDLQKLNEWLNNGYPDN